MLPPEDKTNNNTELALMQKTNRLRLRLQRSQVEVNSLTALKIRFNLRVRNIHVRQMSQMCADARSFTTTAHLSEHACFKSPDVSNGWNLSH